MNPAITVRIPLVCRIKPPGVPLAMRIAELTALTVEPADAGHQQLVARASGVLNYAALIASDVGMPDLAADLCWRHHMIFAEVGKPSRDIAVMSLMPLVNIARLLTREGDGHGAYTLLQQLYGAAQSRGVTMIHDHDVDLSSLIRTDEDHRKLCTELWVTLLVDGARALACQGRWSDAADAMAAHRGIGNRLLDGRQIKIMALVEQGRTDEATAVIDSTIPSEPWEPAVATLLRLSCRPTTVSTSAQELNHMVLTLVTQPDPLTAAFRARLGLTALDLAIGRDTPDVSDLRAAVINVASTDAYAARDVLGHPTLRAQMTREQHQEVTAMLAAAGFGAGGLPAVHADALAAAVKNAEVRLRTLLTTA